MRLEAETGKLGEVRPWLDDPLFPEREEMQRMLRRSLSSDEAAGERPSS
jgi:hypothetical protein